MLCNTMGEVVLLPLCNANGCTTVLTLNGNQVSQVAWHKHLLGYSHLILSKTSCKKNNDVELHLCNVKGCTTTVVTLSGQSVSCHWVTQS